MVLVPIANKKAIEVWVQGIKVESQWQFHDGSPMPFFCSTSMTNGPTEVHIRARGSTDFTFVDNNENGSHNYMCEYNRTLAITN